MSLVGHNEDKSKAGCNFGPWYEVLVCHADVDRALVQSYLDEDVRWFYIPRGCGRIAVDRT